MFLPLVSLAALLLLAMRKAPTKVEAQTVEIGPAVIAPGPAPVVVEVGPAVIRDAELAAALAEAQSQKAVANKVAQVATNGAPDGFDEREAKRRAQSVADHMRKYKAKYDRAILTHFQRLAGLKQDGIYGPQSASALRFFGAKNVPAALFRGNQAKYKIPGE